MDSSILHTERIAMHIKDRASSTLDSHTTSLRMEHRSGNPQRVTPADYSQYRLKCSGSDSNAVVRRELDSRVSGGMDLINPCSGTKMNEKELLRGLNERFAGFIEKVRHLEQHNQLLESEIGEIKERAQSSSSLDQEHGPELRELRQLVHDITHQKHQIEIEHQNLEDELLNLRRKQEREACSRSDAESNIIVLKKDIDDAYQTKLQLDTKAQSLVDEMHFLKKNHEAEVSEMIAQIQEARVTVEAHDFEKPDLTAALRDIRAQLEVHVVSDRQQTGESILAQFAKLTEEAETKREALKKTQAEILEHRRRLQAKSVELECASGTREALEKQLHEVEDRHREDVIHYQGTIKQLENELINTKFDMSGHLREFQDLLNVKMALDVEILSYRKLLEGEESHLSPVLDTHIPVPYIYRQSPVYSLPCLSRSPTRRAEPLYKFVEEIITETTREIEMSEFEETVGGEGDVKAQRGSGQGDNDSGAKDSPEGEGDQVSDRQQDQVAAGETTEHMGLGEGEDSQKDDDIKEGAEGAPPSQESKDLDKPQEPSSAVKAQDNALSLPSETIMKTTDLTVKLMTSLSKKTIETVELLRPSETLVQEPPSKAPKSEEKASHTVPKAVNKVDTVKTTTEDKVTKSSDKAPREESKENDKGSESSLKSDLKVVEDGRPNNRDKTKTVE